MAEEEESEEVQAEDAARQKRHMDILGSHVAQLSEHFDAVQIICTHRVQGDGGTVLASLGSGNWYARYGSVKEWVIKSEKGMKP